MLPLARTLLTLIRYSRTHLFHFDFGIKHGTFHSAEQESQEHSSKDGGGGGAGGGRKSLIGVDCVPIACSYTNAYIIL
jgi:hypothetical protein